MNAAKIVESYNKLHKDKAELVEAHDEFLIVRFLDKNTEEQAEKCMQDFRKKLELEMGVIVIEKIEKNGNDYVVRFARKEKEEDPAEKILNVFGKYYEGTTPHSQQGYED